MRRSGLGIAGLAAVLGSMAFIHPADPYPYREYREPEPRPRKLKPRGQSGPVVDSTPLTKREKRKLRKS